MAPYDFIGQNFVDVKANIPEETAPVNVTFVARLFQHAHSTSTTLKKKGRVNTSPLSPIYLTLITV